MMNLITTHMICLLLSVMLVHATSVPVQECHSAHCEYRRCVQEYNPFGSLNPQHAEGTVCLVESRVTEAMQYQDNEDNKQPGVAQRAKEYVGERLEQLKEGASYAVSRGKDGLHKAGNKVAEKAHDAKEYLGEVARKTGDAAKHAAKTVSNKAKEIGQKTKEAGSKAIDKAHQAKQNVSEDVRHGATSVKEEVRHGVAQSKEQARHKVEEEKEKVHHAAEQKKEAARHSVNQPKS